ncbi:endospore germination permease [Bacillus pseudomycoides]|uniref:Endospore germination permease n=1 Tax=Bacillus bingmayongensis TaxID=1150157 RepID=A0ABU5JWL1_9BACI|nr:endospore germination permease [Bacillus pseudomycoides]
MRNSVIRNLTLFEYIVFIHSIQIASGVLTMPSPIANIAGTDGWVSIVLGWIISSIIGILIVSIFQTNPNMNFFQILRRYFGKWLGTLLIILYAFYLFFAGFNTILKTIEVVKIWIFPSTPSYQIAILLLIPFYILAWNGIQAITRYSIIVFFFTAWMPLVFIFALKHNFHPLHLLPVLKDGIYPVLQAVKETVTPYAGLEIVYFIYPLLQKKEKAQIGIVIANTGTMLLYLYVTLFCYVYFSPEGVKEIIWPVFQLLKGIRFSFLERLEIIYIAYYLIVFSTTVYPYLFFSIYSVTNVFKRLSRNWSIISFIFFIILIFMFFNPDVNQLLFIYSFMDNLNSTFFILFPVFFFIYITLINWVTRRKQL